MSVAEYKAKMLLQPSITILVLENQDIVRSLMCDVLKTVGHRVLEARSSHEALSLCENHPGQIDLLLTSTSPSQMTAGMLFEKAVKTQPHMKVLYASGHLFEELIDRGLVNEDTHFIGKPFTPEALIAKVRQIFDKRVTMKTAANPKLTKSG